MSIRREDVAELAGQHAGEHEQDEQHSVEGRLPSAGAPLAGGDPHQE
jgi:hypothetical protein